MKINKNAFESKKNNSNIVVVIEKFKKKIKFKTKYKIKIDCFNKELNNLFD